MYHNVDCMYHKGESVVNVSIHKVMMVYVSLVQESINSLQSNGRLGASQIGVWPSQISMTQSNVPTSIE